MAHNFTTHTLGWAAMPIHFTARRPMTSACDRSTSFLLRCHLQDRFQIELRNAIRLALLRPRSDDPYLSCAFVHKLLPTTLPRPVLDYLILANLRIFDAPWDSPHYTSAGLLQIRLSDGRGLALDRDTLSILFSVLNGNGSRLPLAWDHEEDRGPRENPPGSGLFLDGRYPNSSEAATELLAWLDTSFNFRSHLFLVTKDTRLMDPNAITVAELLNPPAFTRYNSAAKTGFLSPRPESRPFRRCNVHAHLNEMMDACYPPYQHTRRFINRLDENA
jgi:hypothetical protein